MVSRILVVLTLLCGAALAQNNRFDNVALGPKGPVPNATVAVCTQPANTSITPCTPLAPLCSSLSDAVCSSPNPVTADSLGNYHFYAKQAQAPYTVQIYGPAVASPFIMPDQQLGATSGVSAGGNNTFTGNNTHSGTETFTGPTTVKNLNAVRFADQFPGATADLQITAAEADLPAAGGTVDARGYGCVPQTLANTLAIGSASKQVLLIIDRCTQFNITTTGGVDAIQLWVESGITALDTGNVLLVGNFVVSNTANINNVIASYPRAGPSIANLKGITLKGNAAATITGAMLDLTGVTDKSTIQDVIGYNFNGPGLRILNAAGGVPSGPVNILNNSWNGSGLAGARPVQINCVAGGGIIAGINFFGGSLTHPGTGGLPILDIQGTATNCVNGVNLYGTQFESINSGDIGINIVNGLGITGSGLVFTAAGTAGAACIKISQSGGLSHTLVFDNITNFNAWTNTVQDTINSVNITDPRLTHYSYLGPTANAGNWYSANGLLFGITSTGPLLGSKTFATLPTPANGSMIYCSDCNATCTAGGGTGRTCFRENGAWIH